MLDDLQIEYIKRRYNAKFILEYDFSQGFPCEFTRRILELLSGIPSWQKGIASEQMLQVAKDAWKPCIDLQLFFQIDDANEFNPFIEEVDLQAVYVGPRFEGLVSLIPQAYREQFPKLQRSLPPYVAVIPIGGIKPATPRKWKEILKKLPTFLMETYVEKVIKKK